MRGEPGPDSVPPSKYFLCCIGDALIVSLLEIDAGGKERLLTKDWLKGSHREFDVEKSKPWEPIHTYGNPAPLEPGIKLMPTANLFKAGSRIALRIRCVDDEPTNPLELVATSSLNCTAVVCTTDLHNDAQPSYLLVPITRRNVLNTYFLFPRSVA